MRLEQYLTEKVYDKNELLDLVTNTIVPTLKKECSQYLKEGLKKPLKRGTHTPVTKAWTKVMPRESRKPSDTPVWVQDAFDDASKKVFGIKFRSQGVFTSPIESQATDYGTAYDFYPINGYSYLWSPKIKDFYNKYRADISQDPMAKVSFTEEADPEYWEYILREYYQNYDLKKNTKNEVMFHCPKGYYLIKIDAHISDSVRDRLGYRL